MFFEQHQRFELFMELQRNDLARYPLPSPILASNKAHLFQLHICHHYSDSIAEGRFMPLVTVVIAIAVVGLLMWLVNRYIPMQGTIKGILNAVVVIALVLWLLKVFGLLNYLTQFRVGH